MGGDQVGATGRHLGGEVLVDLHAVLDGGNTSLDGGPCPMQRGGVGRHPGPALPCRHRGSPYLVGGERRGLPIGSVEIELDQVGPVVELRRHRRHQGVAVGDLDGAVEGSGAGDPGAGGAHIGAVASTPPPVAYSQRERPDGAPIVAPGGADIPGPPHAGGDQAGSIVLGVPQQRGRLVVEMVDPVGSAGEGEVAVAVDHPGNERGPAGVHHDGIVARCFVRRTDPGDPIARHEHRLVQGESRAPGIGEGATVIEHGHGLRVPATPLRTW